jgi:hypothetical protein
VPIHQSKKRNYNEANNVDSENEMKYAVDDDPESKNTASNMNDLSIEDEMSLDEIIREIELIMEDKKITTYFAFIFMKKIYEIKEIISNKCFQSIYAKIVDHVAELDGESNEIHDCDSQSTKMEN